MKEGTTPEVPNECVPIVRSGVRGFLDLPRGTATCGMVLTHGAGGNCNGPLLLAIAAAFNQVGIAVLRCDLPFRQRRAVGPPTPSLAAADRAGLRAAVTVLREMALGAVYLGGHSYGGRQSSILAADEPDLVESLLLLSYPLHPPNKPAQLRTAHFPNLRTPTVFVHGTADPFGSLEELETALKTIPARAVLLPIQGAGHDLRRGKFELQPVAAALIR